jgi:eukaryotic-like serine/threonine-protein kinase
VPGQHPDGRYRPSVAEGREGAGVDPGALLDGRYRLGPVLARGGMSVVYRGVDTRLDRPVAIKVMDPRLAADPAFRTRFEREARAAARLDHPAVVDVHDQGADGPGDGGSPPVVFLVMELVEGGTLRDVLAARGALAVPAAVAVLGPVLAGLAEAHRARLVHRDVKPENVLISRAGAVKMADFGLVTAATHGASHAGLILGTVAYLSPEQVATGAADARSDVYAVGVMAYELLTGAAPYTGDTPISVAYRHVHDEVPAPSTVARDVPPELDDLVVRATRRDPAARPADAAAFLAELCRIAERAGVPRVPPPVPPDRAEPGDDPGRAETVAVATWATAGAGPRGTRTLPRPASGEPVPPVPGWPGSAWEGRGARAGDPWVPNHAVLRRRGRRTFAAWVAVVAALGLLVAGAGWWLGEGRWTAMPSVVGMDRAAAERLLVRSDLVAAVVVAHDDAVAAGLVTAADPAAEARLLRGSAVRLTVSSGRPVVPVISPGTAVEAAEQAVRDAGLTPARSQQFDATVPAGAVVRPDPAAGTALPSGGSVTLVVSRGPAPPRQVRVPLVVGKRADEAEQALTRAGLDVERSAGFPFRDDDDARVVDQSAGPGSLVDRGTVVTLRAL